MQKYFTHTRTLSSEGNKKQVIKLDVYYYDAGSKCIKLSVQPMTIIHENGYSMEEYSPMAGISQRLANLTRKSDKAGRHCANIIALHADEIIDASIADNGTGKNDALAAVVLPLVSLCANA